MVGAVPTFAAETPIAEKSGLVESELKPDRIDRNDRCQQSGIAAGSASYEVADRHPPIADLAVDRRTQFAVLVEVEFGRMHHCFLSRDGRFGNVLGLYALVVGLFGDRFVLHQALAALEI